MEQLDKYHQAVADSKVSADDAAVKAAVDELLAKHAAENMNDEVYRFIFNSIDLTTLNSTDSPASVARFTDRVNAFENEYPDLPPVAAICVYPNMVQVVRTVLDVSSVEIAAVSGGFPSSQTFAEVKVAETALAVSSGADEIDIVINLGDFLDGDYESVTDEIAELKEATRDGRLKVILETGALQTAERIKAASVLSLYAGADFLKTSTGKGYPGASLEAAYVMAQCIKEYHEKTGRKVGFKAAGGVRTAEDAVKYYTVIKEVLGEQWLTNDLFRIGASGLANNLLGKIIGQPDVKFF
ncbi:MAG: deoxyribose-phosphate aldolase [Muribaculaceae bacterium]|nr:deoxyribose-phosphate aldolase [Muribaculaceae bacterium]MDE6462867.1 deoxyribose-phosphate aldolase [Muribaculaceae bacterium]MDE6509787.1 deoxyribose-phosphate aldolase [Muribaculaceae bacterium]MDE7143381.1 deoxyribose-phosphate aldolase [Muribaculaceae bacterium]